MDSTGSSSKTALCLLQLLQYCISILTEQHLNWQPQYMVPCHSLQRRLRVEAYKAALLIWQTGEAVLKQAIASTIPDSLFLDVQKELTAKLMWDAVTNKCEKKSRMVTVDLRCKLQSEMNGDVRAHLIKLQTMHEDLASMGRSINNEDFMSIILGSIPLSYDTFISAMSATSMLLGSSLSPTNLIDAIGDEAD